MVIKKKTFLIFGQNVFLDDYFILRRVIRLPFILKQLVDTSFCPFLLVLAISIKKFSLGESRYASDEPRTYILRTLKKCRRKTLNKYILYH